MPKQKKGKHFRDNENRSRGFSSYELLRYFLPGAAFLLTVFIAFNVPSWISERFPSSVFSAAIGAVLILVFGVSLYCVHRAISHPILSRLAALVALMVLKLRGHEVETTSRMILEGTSLDVKRWERYQDPSSLQQYMNEWSNHVHYLYCTGLAVLLAAWAGWSLDWAATEALSTVISAASALVISGFISNTAYHVREIYLSDCL